MTEIIVEVQQGFIRGKKSVNYKNGRFYSFYGIPYALPPLGELRFKAPRPPERWIGIRDATQEKEGCICLNSFTQRIEGGEDCLFLNVYTSMLPSTAPKPVVVWIHGGAFQTGSTKTEFYGPDFLLIEDIVLVTVSYRLGALGFLCLEDTNLGITGNNGLRDMIMALKWVQVNIASFLGDAGNVTLFGESSGAVSAHYLMLSPLAKGLFHKIILHSGCTLVHWAKGFRDSAIKLAAVLGFRTNDEEEILKFLQKQSAETIFKGQHKLRTGISSHIIRHFYPVIEKVSSLHPPVIAQDPVVIITKGEYNKVPMLMGHTSAEELFFEYKIKSEARTDQSIVLLENMEEFIPHHLEIPPGSPHSKFVANQIKAYYFNGENPTIKYRKEFCKAYGDVFFNYGLLKTVTMHQENLGHPIYYFRFSVDGKFNFYKDLHGAAKLPGASHSDDICYFFKTYLVDEVLENSLEDITIQRVVKFWTNFARSSDPNVKEYEKNIAVHWRPVERGELHFLDIGTDLSMDVNPDWEMVQFWDSIYNTHYPKGKL